MLRLLLLLRTSCVVIMTEIIWATKGVSILFVLLPGFLDHPEFLKIEDIELPDPWALVICSVMCQRLIVNLREQQSLRSLEAVALDALNIQTTSHRH